MRPPIVSKPAPMPYVGFEDHKELARMVWELALDSQDRVRAYEHWNKTDRSKLGLQVLPKRDEFAAKSGLEAMCGRSQP